MSGSALSTVIGRMGPGLEKLLRGCDNCQDYAKCSPEHRLAVNFICEKWQERFPVSAD